MKDKIISVLKWIWEKGKWVILGIGGAIVTVFGLIFIFRKVEDDDIISQDRVKEVQRTNQRIVDDSIAYSKSRAKRRKKLSE